MEIKAIMERREEGKGERKDIRYSLFTPVLGGGFVLNESRRRRGTFMR